MSGRGERTDRVTTTRRMRMIRARILLLGGSAVVDNSLPKNTNHHNNNEEEEEEDVPWLFGDDPRRLHDTDAATEITTNPLTIIEDGDRDRIELTMCHSYQVLSGACTTITEGVVVSSSTACQI
jgi:hypothetical protein